MVDRNKEAWEAQGELGLPPLSRDHAEAKAHLEKYGLALLADALSAEEVLEAKNRVMDQAEAERRAGVAVLDGRPVPADEEFGDSGPNQRVWSLMNKGSIFRDLVVKDRVLKLISEAFAANFDGTGHVFDPGVVLLSSSTANIAMKGGDPMYLHFDQRIAPFKTPYAFHFNTMIMLTDFTAENGATLVAPGSHIAPDPESTYDAQVIPAEAPAGTIMIFDGRLLHGTGANETDEPRIGLINFFCMAFARSQENFALTLDPEVFAKCSDKLKALMGFRSWNTLGTLDGRRGHHLLPTRFTAYPKKMSIADQQREPDSRSEKPTVEKP